VARYCAKAFELPVVIARLNAAYGPGAGLPAYHLETLAGGEPVVTKWDPCPYSLIHQDDINGQTAALLDAAKVPATIVNWAGDEAVTVQQWAAYLGELMGLPGRVVVRETPGALRGLVADISKRQSITGPCSVSWQDGMTRIWQARQDGLSDQGGQGVH